MESGNPYVMSMATQVGVMFAALCSLIGIIVQAKQSGKTKKSDALMETIDKKLDVMKERSKQADEEIKASMNEHHLRYYKDQLVTTMSRIENGYMPTIEEKHVLHEQKAKYNELGGDSYVDEMWEKLIKKDLI